MHEGGREGARGRYEGEGVRGREGKEKEGRRVQGMEGRSRRKERMFQFQTDSRLTSESAIISAARPFLEYLASFPGSPNPGGSYLGQ